MTTSLGTLSFVLTIKSDKAMVTYKGYPIRKRQTGYKSHVWDVIVEDHDRCPITGKEIIKERVTYTGKTLD